MKVAVITGVAGDLGSEVAKKFLAESFHVIGTLKPGSSRNEHIPKHENFTTDALDLSKTIDTEKFTATLLQQRESIDVAILSAGGYTEGSLLQTSSGDIRTQCDVNFFTAYNIVRPIFLRMIQQGYGKLFFIGSRSGVYAKEGLQSVAYSIAKSMLIQLAKILQAEASSTGIDIFVIIPSVIDTVGNRQAMPEADTSSWVTPDVIADRIFRLSALPKQNDRNLIIEL